MAVVYIVDGDKHLWVYGYSRGASGNLTLLILLMDMATPFWRTKPLGPKSTWQRQLGINAKFSRRRRCSNSIVFLHPCAWSNPTLQLSRSILPCIHVSHSCLVLIMHSILSLFPLTGHSLTLDSHRNAGPGGEEKTASWPVRLECSGKQVDLQLQDPSYSTTNSPSEVQDSDELLRWYLEKHSEEPFEVPKAESAAARLSLYGATLAESLVSSGILPDHGQHLYIEVISYLEETEQAGKLPGPDINRLHWEVLEQVELWPKTCTYQSITVSRCILDRRIGNNLESTSATQYPSFSSIASGEKGLNILLVVSRPKPTHDPDHQLVSRRLVAVLERLSTQSSDVKASVHILRPPTWQAFKEHLLVDHTFGHYDIVHLDMHGEIEDSLSEKPR
jgi:hypothetical protein